jgi:hypothetical protein
VVQAATLAPWIPKRRLGRSTGLASDADALRLRQISPTFYADLEEAVLEVGAHLAPFYTVRQADAHLLKGLTFG